MCPRPNASTPQPSSSSAHDKGLKSQTQESFFYAFLALFVVVLLLAYIYRLETALEAHQLALVSLQENYQLLAQREQAMIQAYFSIRENQSVVASLQMRGTQEVRFYNLINFGMSVFNYIWPYFKRK